MNPNTRDNHKNPGIKRHYFRLPEIRDEIDSWCKIEMCIPDDDDYRNLLNDVLTMLSTWAFYDRSEDQGGARVAKIWRNIQDKTNLLGSCSGGDCGCGCGGDDGGCGNFMSDCDCNCQENL